MPEVPIMLKCTEVGSAAQLLYQFAHTFPVKDLVSRVACSIDSNVVVGF